MKIKLLDRVDHDGVRHEAGAVLDLPDDQAEALKRVGAAEAVADKKKPAEG